MKKILFIMMICLFTASTVSAQISCLSDDDCNDGLFCNGVETCDIGGTDLCIPGTPPCDDGNECTTDPCDEDTDTCGEKMCDVETLYCYTAPCMDSEWCTEVGCLQHCDADCDLLDDASDNCPNTPNAHIMGTCTRGNIGQLCDPWSGDAQCDTEMGAGDGFCSSDQEDIDDDGIGDACDNCPNGIDDDMDKDNVCSDVDNCPNTPNPDQLDTYPPQGNGIGDVCDCECDFDCSGGVDAIDVTSFLVDFGRSTFNNPCSDADPCNGDVDCNVNVDALDLNKFLEDFGRSHFNNPCPPCQVEPWCVYDMCPYCDKVNVTIRVPEELGQQPGFLIAYLWSVDNWEFPPLVPPDAGTDYNQVRNPDIDIDNSYVMTVPGCTFYRERCVSGDYYLYVLLQMEGPSMPLVPQLGDYCWGMDQDPITLGSGQMLEIDKDITLVPFVAP